MNYVIQSTQWLYDNTLFKHSIYITMADFDIHVELYMHIYTLTHT